MDETQNTRHIDLQAVLEPFGGVVELLRVASEARARVYREHIGQVAESALAKLVDKGTTQKALAERIGYSQQELSNIRDRIQNMKKEKAEELLYRLAVPPESWSPDIDDVRVNVMFATLSHIAGCRHGLSHSASEQVLSMDFIRRVLELHQQIGGVISDVIEAHHEEIDEYEAAEDWISIKKLIGYPLAVVLALTIREEPLSAQESQRQSIQRFLMDYLQNIQSIQIAMFLDEDIVKAIESGRLYPECGGEMLMAHYIEYFREIGARKGAKDTSDGLPKPILPLRKSYAITANGYSFSVPGENGCPQIRLRE